jgi:uncharacterized protein YccT (UPF0319 family)
MIVASLLVISPVHAEVRLELGDGVNLHAIDGKAWSAPGVFDARSPITLEDGTHQLVLELKSELGRNRDDSVIESSDSFVLLFRAEDQDLVLSAPSIGTRNELEEFNDYPEWQLRDRQGNDVSFKIDVLEKTGFQLVRDYEDEIADFNRTGNSEAALMPSPDVRTPLLSSPKSMSAGDVSENQEVVRQMLRYWYLKADENTKSEMKRWINSGE